ncbi:hypothetical protein LC087_15935 [Bacillus carboniphilus]|uniref:Uncharacterized protein n=1 Tax=Bacillus carboniphilus TaxID=86663 RepID=A0ABY9JUU8_9BACI|nr:hypothetical protein [Bacillus carboniphilus]WLR42212.1 hypothetical protein LC087_15935 [Bacillus carboniphilus]
MKQLSKDIETKMINPKILYYGTPVILLTTLLLMHCLIIEFFLSVNFGFLQLIRS